MNITKVYPCGCSATGPSSIPDYCPTHSFVLSLHRCKICGTRWLLWPAAIHGGGWNLLDKYSRPGACCDNVAMGEQIEHLRDIPLQPAPATEPQGWQPIATAPKNGILVLVCGQNGVVLTGFYGDGRWQTEYVFYTISDPTHWMPLPAAPASAPAAPVPQFDQQDDQSRMDGVPEGGPVDLPRPPSK